MQELDQKISLILQYCRCFWLVNKHNNDFMEKYIEKYECQDWNNPKHSKCVFYLPGNNFGRKITE